MVGLVIVSHSRALGDALIDLVGQVTNTEIPISVAAGVGPERSEFGTDAVEIMEAIQSVYSDDGVLVLMDLGSAILSAEMAVELLPTEMAQKVKFCAAPVVEGAIAAGVQIGLGANLEAACQEAQTALIPKIEHISGAGDQGLAVVADDRGDLPTAFKTEEFEETVLTLVNLHGLHARPAARFVQAAASYPGEVQVTNLTNGKGPVSAKSLNAVTTLGAVKNHQISIKVHGSYAREVLGKLSALVNSGFGEEISESEEISQAPLSEKKTEEFDKEVIRETRNVPISEGIAVGPLFRYRPPIPPISNKPAENQQLEWEKLKQAIEITGKTIASRRQELEQSIGKSEAEIFSAHQLILEDPEVQNHAQKLIFEGNMNASAAWDEAIKKIAGEYNSLEDSYLQQRAADVLDVGAQVLFTLAGESGAGKIELDHSVILYARELTPTETSQLDMEKILGIMTSGGGPTSHSAILARALGIPAISGVSPELDRKKDGLTVGINGFTGEIWIDPEKTVIQELENKRNNWLENRKRLLEDSASLALTKDGQRVDVVANVGNVQDANAAVKNGAEGIGLLRTEFLFLTQQEPPNEQQQFEILREIGEVINSGGDNDRPVIVRTLDVGGDKNLPYLNLPEEDNPFLGVRAIRMSLRNPEVFKTQIRAFLRAADGFNFKIMFPMVANLEEVLQAKAMMKEVHSQLEENKITHKWPVETGIMVEIPAAAIQSGEIAKHVDFFSIGTNDLTQYTMAAERGNPQLSNLNDAMHPAVLKLIKEVVQAANDHGKWVGVCGELAGDPMAAMVLIGIGVHELSMNPGSIPRIKAAIKNISMDDSMELARTVLDADSAESAREIARKFLAEHE